MKHEQKAVELTSEQIAQSIGELETKLAEAQAAVTKAEVAVGGDWKALLAGGQTASSEQLALARYRADALQLALTAARGDLEAAQERERRAAHQRRRNELLANLEQRGKLADEIGVDLQTFAKRLDSYFAATMRTRQLVGARGSIETAAGTRAGIQPEHFSNLQRLVEIELRNIMPGLWRSTEAVLATPKPIAERLREKGAEVLAEFDARGDSEPGHLPA